MLVNVIAAVASMAFVLGWIIRPQVKAVRAAGSHVKAGMIGAALFTLTFAALIATLFLTNDRARRIDAVIIGILAIAGTGLLIFAQGPRSEP